LLSLLAKVQRLQHHLHYIAMLFCFFRLRAAQRDFAFRSGNIDRFCVMRLNALLGVRLLRLSPRMQLLPTAARLKIPHPSRKI
jgi:hypothetical protein